jgi:hypothetical protein
LTAAVVEIDEERPGNIALRAGELRPEEIDRRGEGNCP